MFRVGFRVVADGLCFWVGLLVFGLCWSSTVSGAIGLDCLFVGIGLWYCLGGYCVGWFWVFRLVDLRFLVLVCRCGFGFNAFWVLCLVLVGFGLLVVISCLCFAGLL